MRHSKVDAFCDVLDKLFEGADAGVLVTVQSIGVRRYLPSSRASD